MLKWFLLALAIVFEVFATLCMKASDGFTRLVPAVGVLLGYGIAFYLDSLVIKLGLSLPVVYAVWSGGGIVLVVIANRILFDDDIPWITIAGLVVIAAGVVMVSFTAVGEL